MPGVDGAHNSDVYSLSFSPWGPSGRLQRRDISLPLGLRGLADAGRGRGLAGGVGICGACLRLRKRSRRSRSFAGIETFTTRVSHASLSRVSTQDPELPGAEITLAMESL
jgi:hypothetical protein